MRQFLPGAPCRRFLLAALAVATLAGCSSSDDSGSAQIRLLNVSTGYDSLDLYAAKDDDSDSRQFEAVAYETVSGYTSLDSGTYTLKLQRNGVSSTLQTLSGEQLADDSHTTYVAYGSTGQFGTLSVGEDQDEADSGYAKIQVLNTAEAGSIDIYLTDEAVSLDDASPMFSDVASGSQTGVGTIDSGEYRLRITGAGDTGDMRLDLLGVSFEDRSVVSVILTATQGGVLVNALFLPQRGDLTVHRNTQARVRGANGVSSGTVLTARIGAATVLSNATLGAIGSGYVQTDAGTAAVSLSVDGNAVTAPSQTLTAGGDYTLLVWNNDAGVQTTLISDDNRLPTTSGKAKLRVINGMSGLAMPITLALNYAPIAEGIALGESSSHTEVDSGSDNQLDVTNTQTGTSLLTQDSISLQSSAVYTLFMSGGGTDATTSGAMRKDR